MPDLTAGPNNPTDPPKPTVSGAAISGKYICFLPLINPSLFLDREKYDGWKPHALNGFFMDIYLAHK